MIATGIAIFLSLLLIALKLPTRMLLRGLNYHLAIDVGVTLLVLVVHFGTFSGVMAATFAGLLTSLTTSLTRRLLGYIRNGKYVPGYFTLNV
ncbi:MAG: hypothetical protein J0H69_08455 [Burkholderiales bacterium]|nr:hypothetical protein [Burkholderiales bacterium]